MTAPDGDGRLVWDWICPLCKGEWTGSHNMHACKGRIPVGSPR